MGPEDCSFQSRASDSNGYPRDENGCLERRAHLFCKKNTGLQNEFTVINVHVFNIRDVDATEYRSYSRDSEKLWREGRESFRISVGSSFKIDRFERIVNTSLLQLPILDGKEKMNVETAFRCGL